MDRTPEEKFILLFETAKRSLLACEAMLKRVSAELAALESDLLQGVDVGDRVVSPLLSAVSFIDFAHRYRSIVLALHLISKKAPEIKRLEAALAPVEASRHYLQHLQKGGELSSSDPIEYPVFGSLGWTHHNSAFVVSFAQASPNLTQFLPPFSVVLAPIITVIQSPTVRHQYRVKGVAVNLEEVLSEMRTAYDWIAGKITTNNPDLTRLSWGQPQSIWYRLSVTLTTTSQAGESMESSG